ncbi:MAG: caspase family protein [Pseudomonadales bacterium]
MFKLRALRTLPLTVLGCLLGASGALTAAEGDSAMAGYQEVAALHVVDCLLPGQVRRLGTRTYLTPRRPIRTTAADCSVRGGEYTAYDRADYRSALRVWMPAAEAGNAEAQTHVGEIFERGLGDEPNYEAAALWYERAAKQGYARAQFNLGTLYEQGHGVARNPVVALNWYRRAWGIEEDSLMFASAAEREREEMRRELETAVQEKQDQIEFLDRRLEELEQALSASAEGNANAAAEARTLKTLLGQLQAQQQQSKTELASLPAPAVVQETSGPRTRQPAPAELAPVAGLAEQRRYKDLSLGGYYALLIGNQNYQQMEDLSTPISDLRRAEKLLKEKYGFTVFTIADGDNIEVMRAINDLYEIVGEEDNLLIFYAGHGNRLTTGGAEIGYWLPSNAERPPRNTFWVANEFVTGHLSRLKAKRVLVVADSCYAGLLSQEPSFLLLGNDGPRYDDMAFLSFKLDKRARLLLSSGGDAPVLDEGGGGHSIFAKAFLDELENNDRLLPSPELFLRVREQVTASAAALEFDQTPEFKTIKSAGHEVGDFFFVPANLL